MGDVLQITRTNHIEQLMEQIGQAQYRDSHLADLHFICGDGKVVHGHAGIIGSLSQAIRQSLTTRIPFSNVNRGLSGHIDLFDSDHWQELFISMPDVHSRDLRTALELIYSGQVMLQNTQEQSRAVLNVLDMLQIPIQCENLVIQIQYGQSGAKSHVAVGEDAREAVDSMLLMSSRGRYLSEANNNRRVRRRIVLRDDDSSLDEVSFKTPLGYAENGDDASATDEEDDDEEEETTPTLSRGSCSKCGKIYKKCVRRHLVSHEAKCLGLAVCSVCETEVPAMDLPQHMLLVHQTPDTPKPKGNPKEYFPCEICGRSIHKIWVKRHRNERHPEYADCDAVEAKRPKLARPESWEQFEAHPDDGEAEDGEGFEGGKIYNCSRCEFQGAGIARLRVHLFGHFRAKIKEQYLPHGFKVEEDCPFCHYKASVATNLLSHIALTHRKIEEFLTGDEVDQLFPKPPNRPKLVSKIVSHDLRDTPDLAPPQIATGPPRRWSMSCPQCEKTIYYSNMKNHLCEHYEANIQQYLEDTSPGSLVCHFCHWRAPNGSALITHVGRRHNLIMDHLDPPTRLKMISFDEAWEIEAEEGDAFRCSQCAQVFATHLETCRHMTMTNCTRAPEPYDPLDIGHGTDQPFSLVNPQGQTERPSSAEI